VTVLLESIDQNSNCIFDCSIREYQSSLHCIVLALHWHSTPMYYTFYNAGIFDTAHSLFGVAVYNWISKITLTYHFYTGADLEILKGGFQFCSCSKQKIIYPNIVPLDIYIISCTDFITHIGVLFQKGISMEYMQPLYISSTAAHTIFYNLLLVEDAYLQTISTPQ